jgi:hypothetical protein
MDARFFRAAAHVVDLELNDGAANFGFDFAFGFHGQAGNEHTPCDARINAAEVL